MAPAAAFPPLGPFGLGSPPSSVLCSSSDSLPPVPVGSSPSPPGTSAPLPSLPSAAGALTTYGPGLCSPGSLSGLLLWRWQGLPGSWQAPLSTCPALGLRRPLSPGSFGDSVLPSARRTASAVATADFGAQSHGRHPRPLPPLLAPVTRMPWEGRFRLVASLSRAGLSPAGLVRKVSVLTLRHPFPLPQASPGGSSGRPGRLPAQAPHRSVHEEFPHTAPQDHGFAAPQ